MDDEFAGGDHPGMRSQLPSATVTFLFTDVEGSTRGLHELGAEAYAQIAAAGHGGQVLLSAATRALVDGGVNDLGEHRLKDFAEPVAIFQFGEKRFAVRPVVGRGHPLR
jgi:class 3 adenylate cyclase